MHHKWRSYDMWFPKCKVRQTEIFVILGNFLPFQPPDNPENQNFKIKKTPGESKFWKNEKKPAGDIIILHRCTINDNHVMYGSWDMECDRQSLLSFWTIFCTFTPLTIQNMKILKKWKKISEDIIILHMCTINDSHMRYDSWDMKCDR